MEETEIDHVISRVASLEDKVDKLAAEFSNIQNLQHEIIFRLEQLNERIINM